MHSLTKPFLLGIAGPSGAGKSTLARALAERFPAVLFPTDHYYRDLSHLPFEERTRQNFDHPDAIESELLIEHLSQLAQGRTIERPVYDFSIHTRLAMQEPVAPSQFLIVEGLFTLHYPRLREILNLKIFIEAAAPLCFERRLERDIHERGRTPESVRRQYTETVHPMAEEFILPSRRYADMVLSGTAPLHESVEEIANTMKQKVPPR